MSIIPNSNPFEDSPFSSAISTSLPELSRENPAFHNNQIDWKETPEAHVFKADISGLKKEEVKVEVEDGKILQISGERSMEKEDNNDGWHRFECSSGKFKRSFTLPANAKLDQVKASMENGVLTVTVPKEDAKAIESLN
ncbi:18.5 kDa class I heat shock protein-like [Gastrolobium bilobum]|uniref:18.5 kDa class I heat shock protein-like n=1 Tax=Gastrolobium bilobum TaxID=150636 RepID=UPI002AB0B630|nr:18.5 kDa class I heat shock protein-like [Gastrolobium bilobum]